VQKSKKGLDGFLFVRHGGEWAKNGGGRGGRGASGVYLGSLSGLVWFRGSGPLETPVDPSIGLGCARQRILWGITKPMRDTRRAWMEANGRQSKDPIDRLPNKMQQSQQAKGGLHS
jgi:hypothetical protein